MIQKQTISSSSPTDRMSEQLRQLRQSERRMGRTGSNKNKSKKKLKYNSKEIAALLLNANTSQAAASVLMMARSRLTDMMSASATGQYDKTEVMNAIRHADKMVNCAQRKMHNLKEEETEKHQHKKAKESLSKEYNKGKRSVKKQELMLKKQELLLKRKSRRHRNEERTKIDEANHSYEIGKRGTNQSNSFVNSSERLVLAELEKLKLREREEKADSIRGESIGTDSAGAVVDVSVSGEMEGEISVDTSEIDICI